MTQSTPTLFDAVRVGELSLANRVVMAPLTRNRAPDAVPTPLMAEYYSQRASAGLLITEATAISHQGQGYADVPGLYGTEQLDGWKRVTQSVHAAGGKIVVQLWHVGRVSHTSLQPEGGKPVAPSALTAKTKTVLLKDGVPTFVDTSEPRALLATELPDIVHTYQAAARNAVETAGFDGVEIHGANGYLLDQFLKDGSNLRRDDFGGSIENRARLLLEVVDAVVKTAGADKVGVRLSPVNPFNDMHDSNPQALFEYVAEALNRFNLAYLHAVEGGIHGGGKAAPFDFVAFRKRFKGSYIANLSYDKARGNAAIASGHADAIAYGVPFIANPDLVERFKKDAPLNVADSKSFYGGIEKGYTDYPFLAA